MKKNLLNREQIREIVTEELKLMDQEPLSSSDLAKKLKTLEFLTRDEVYNTSPEESSKLIQSNFEEVVVMNSTISAMSLMAMGQGGMTLDSLDNVDPDIQPEVQTIKSLMSFIEKYPAAAGMGENTSDVLSLLRNGIETGDEENVESALEQLAQGWCQGIHSCVKARIEEVDTTAGTVVFSFVSEDDREEFTDFLKIPKKDPAMVRFINCEFEDGWPKVGSEYDLNIVELMEFSHTEVSDSSTVGVEIDVEDLEYNPFYETSEDMPEDYDFNIVVVINGVPCVYASNCGPIPLEYLFKDGSVNIDLLDEVEGAIGYLPDTNSEDDIEINVPYIEKRLEGQQFATVDTYKRTFVDHAKVGLVAFDRDDEDPSKYVWIARPKDMTTGLANLERLAKGTIRVGSEDQAPVESFKILGGKIILK